MDRSPRKSFLLTDLQHRREKNLQLGDIISHIVEFSQDRHGSKFVQQKLRDATVHRKDMIYYELKPSMISLMKDKYANFVIQRFYEIASPRQHQEIFEFIMDNFQELSFDIYGCRVVQFAIESANYQEQAEIFRNLIGHVIRFARNQFAHHVLLKCFTRFNNKESLDFVACEFHCKVAMECRHQYSCRVIQQLLEFGSNEQRDLILHEIMPSAIPIVQDRYGNYVIQSVLAVHAQGKKVIEILQQIFLDFWNLSQDKYASNVAEKLLDMINHSIIHRLYQDLMALPDDQLLILFKHRYANYILQKLVQKLDFSENYDLLHRVERYRVGLGRHLGARRIVDALKQQVCSNLITV